MAEPLRELVVALSLDSSNFSRNICTMGNIAMSIVGILFNAQLMPPQQAGCIRGDRRHCLHNYKILCFG